MSEFRRIDDSFYVAPQITADDIQRAYDEGFGALIMNRPSGETPDQPDTEELIEASANHQLRFYHIPIVAPPSYEDIAATIEALNAENGNKVLAFCRSGTRSVTLWAYAMAKENTYPIETILQKAAEAGYDLSGHRPRLEAIASN